MHNRHTIVYAKYRAWCTLNNTYQLPVEQIHDLCDMHLVYLGHNTYGKLREKSAITPSIEVTQDMVNARLNCISSLHRIVDNLKTTANINQLSMPGLVETVADGDLDEVPTVGALEPVAGGDAEQTNSVLSISLTMSSPRVPRLVEMVNRLDDERTGPVLELPLGKSVSTTVVTASGSTPLSVPTTSSALQGLAMLSQSSPVGAGVPMHDTDSVMAYRPDTTAVVLDKSTQKQPTSDRVNMAIDTSRIQPVPKLCDLSYSIVSHHNLLDPSSTPTGQRRKINSTMDKKDPDIIVLGEAHILDYDQVSTYSHCIK